MKLNSILSPLFLRLYLSVLSAISLSLIIVVSVTEYYLEQYELKDFSRDVTEVRLYIENKYKKGASLDGLIRQVEDFSGFIIEIDPVNEKPDYASSEEIVGIVGDISIYESIVENAEFTGLMPFLDKYWLTVSDAEYEDDSDEDIIIGSSFVYGGMLLLFSLAAVLFYPVYRISRQVQNLTATSGKIARGDYASRSPVLGPAPLDSLAERFNSMAEHIERSVHERDVFSHAIAHELRTPLSRMQLAIGIIARCPLDEKVSGLINDLDDYTGELQKLTDDILSLALLQHQDQTDCQKKLAKQDVNINDLVEETFADYKDQYLNLKLELINAGQISIQANKRHIQLAMDNLIRNACRYAKQQVQVKISTVGELSMLEISDDGCGIPEKDRETVLLPFARLESSRDRNSGGTGLGLAIVNMVVKRYGQSIAIKQSELGGAKIVILF